jgi:hypothetical protein
MLTGCISVSIGICFDLDFLQKSGTGNREQGTGNREQKPIKPNIYKRSIR